MDQISCKPCEIFNVRLLRLAGAGAAAPGACAMSRPQQDLPGDKIMHTALVGFVNRNYKADEQGCWYFRTATTRMWTWR